MRIVHKCLVLPLCAFTMHALAEAKTITVDSPNQSIRFELSDDNHSLTYDIRFIGDTVVRDSVLNLTIDGKDTVTESSLSRTSRYKADETYPWRGNHSKAVNRYNGAMIDIKGKNFKYAVDVRVFNNGVAFRYVVENKGKSVTEADNTAFVLPMDAVAYWQGDINNYEGGGRKTKVGDFNPGQTIGPPLTIKLADGGYASITEGGLTSFAGISLVSEGNGSFKAKLNGTATVEGDVITPWRVIMIGNDLNSLVNNDIVHNVSPSYDKKLFPQGFDTPWIKPGRCVWSWLAGNGPVSFENMKKFTDYASELGFEYNLVDEGWEKWTDGGKDKWELIRELVEYSNKKNVKIWIWKAYDRADLIDLKRKEDKREFLKKCKEAGVVGVKLDFFDHENQTVIKYCQDALKDAAELGLMVDFHGMPKPTGETRTWPNEMTREGVRGLENSNDWPFQDTWAPFTRYLAGHADYTPMSLTNIAQKETTWPHQIASAAIFTSPFLCYGANPEAILKNPARNMIESIPAVWDETVVLPQSEIGEVAAFARRYGNTWFVAIMNGHEARELKVNLTFLDKGKYNASMVADNLEKNQDVILQDAVVDNKKELVIKMSKGGGFIARFSKK